MFLCDTCHNKGKCQMGFMHLQSYGKCEDCGQVAGCSDCHNY